MRPSYKEKIPNRKFFSVKYEKHRFAVRREIVLLISHIKVFKISRELRLGFTEKFMEECNFNCGLSRVALFPRIVSLVFDSWILQKSNLRNLSGLSVQMEWAKEFAASSAKRNKLIWKLSPRRCPIVWKNNIKEKFSRMRLSQCRRTLKVKKNLCPFSCFIATFANISH